MDGAMTVAPPTAPPADIVEGALSVYQLQRRLKLVQEAMSHAMKNNEDYGIIPGTPKPTLLKPGAEKLCTLFQLDPQYEITERYEGEHLTVNSRCTLYHAPTGQRLGSGMGLCTTKETRYAFRNAGRKCPKCGKETIIKGKAEYGGGWLCFGKKGGCSAKFKDDDEQITSQSAEKVANENPADQYNTAVKMANKRSLVAAVLNVTAASAIFTQDLEDMVRPVDDEMQEPSQPKAPPVAPPQRKAKEGDAPKAAGLTKMAAKFASKCASCGNEIAVGSTIWYDRVAKVATCDPCHSFSE